MGHRDSSQTKGTRLRSAHVPRSYREREKSCVVREGTHRLRPRRPCDAVFYIQSGKVKLTVVSATGKEATIAILSESDFFGEETLTGHRLRMATVTAVNDCTLMRIEKNAMLRVLHAQHTFSDLFVAHLLSRNIRYQEDLIDHIFNSSEKRLARILLILAGFGKNGIREKTQIPHISQETLAEMVGTTRPRVNAFMNKFRKLGFIDYNGGLEVHGSFALN